MRRRLSIFLPLVVVLLAACSKQGDPSEPQLVMEGWIENGGHPIILLSESITVENNKEISPKDLVNQLAKWAKVTVSNGEKEVVLTGMADSNYFPPYVFTTTRITGEVGKTYSVRVEYKDYVATAKTTIPKPVPLDKVYVKTVSKDSLCSVMCGFTDPPEKGNYYKVFTKTTGKDSHYHPSALSSLSDETLKGYSEIFIYSTQRLLDFIDKPNLKVGEELWIKLYTMDEQAYEYWTNYEVMIASNVANTYYQNDMKSNVDGALGYWNGYGVAGEVKLKLDFPDKTDNPQ